MSILFKIHETNHVKYFLNLILFNIILCDTFSFVIACFAAMLS